MAWRKPLSITAAFTQANKKWPGRSKISDGTIGDAAHSARKSDHNPDASGVIHAFDLTHDPNNGVDCNRLSRMLVAKKDKRVKYIIWNKKICESKDWIWMPYTGSNPHTKHMHVSIHSTSVAENDTSDWWNYSRQTNISIYYIKPVMEADGNKKEDYAFRRAANTWKSANSPCQIHAVTTGAQFKNLWNKIARQCDDDFYEIKKMAIFSHASKGETLDGVEFKSTRDAQGNVIEDGTISKAELENLTILPWSEKATLTLHSCNSGLKEARGWCPAESMRKRQGVTTIGMSGYSYFSLSPVHYVEASSTDQVIYLWAFARGKNSRMGELWYRMGQAIAPAMQPIIYR